MRNIKLTVEYDGTDFSGWQSQAQGERTVQDTLRAAIGEIVGAPVSLHGAGRTDAGVHAMGQVAAFRADTQLSVDVIMRALNAKLPRDLKVVLACDMPDDFHPQFSATSKTYIYLMANMTHLSPFCERYVLKVSTGIDIAAMKDAAGLMGGKRDYASFMASGSSVKDTLRNVIRIELKQSDAIEFLGMSLGGNFITLTVEGEGFLRHMVRNMVGTMLEAGTGKIAPTQVTGIIEACDRNRAGPTAAAKGLFLKEVRYRPA